MTKKTAIILRIAACAMFATGIIFIVLGTAVFNDSNWAGTGMSEPNFGFLVPGIFITFISIPMFIGSFAGHFAKSAVSMQSRLVDHVANMQSQMMKRQDELKEQRQKYCVYCGSKITDESGACKACGAKEQRK